MTKAAVLPFPATACATKSLPRFINPVVIHWIGLGVKYPNSKIDLIRLLIYILFELALSNKYKSSHFSIQLFAYSFWVLWVYGQP
jgi:hypothetical protein